jgi:hypothetical protein
MHFSTTPVPHGASRAMRMHMCMGAPLPYHVPCTYSDINAHNHPGPGLHHSASPPADDLFPSSALHTIASHYTPHCRHDFVMLHPPLAHVLSACLLSTMVGNPSYAHDLRGTARTHRSVVQTRSLGCATIHTPYTIHCPTLTTCHMPPAT